ncbi:MAG: endonuclease/exonuclease/phosphatase family protein [Anaerolineales bacterium]|nr:endonuclease/exonuclease/phosphatase family protein [Anaerolineales bacterium]
MTESTNQSNRSAAAMAVVTSLCVVFGMQFLRIILPAFRYYLRDTLGIGSLTLAPIALAVFALGLLAIPVLRIFGARVALGIAVVGLALVRLLAQFSTQASFDLGLSAIGVTLFVFFMIYAAGQARHTGNWGRLAFFVLFGVSLDTGIHTAAATLDLVWQFDTIPILIVLILTLALAVAYRMALAEGSVTELDESAWGLAWPLLAVGPWIFLQMLMYQNVARTAALSGLTLPLAGLLVTLGNLAGLALVLWFTRSTRISAWLALVLGLLLVVTTLPHEASGVVGVGATIAGQLLSFLLLAVILVRLGAGEPSRTLARTSILVIVGMELLVLFSFLYYASYDIALGFRSPALPPAAALIFALSAWGAARKALPEDQPAPMPYSLAWLGVLLLAFPALLWLRWDTPQSAQAPGGGTPLKVMTYNIHQGYSAGGRMELEAQAREMENAGADIIALQEVSRGNLINGSSDTIEWLSQRLGMPYVFGPTMDPLWGNAVLSRYPITSFSLHELSPDDLLIRRGYIDAEIEAGGGPLRVLATHYHHPEDGSDIRVIQSQEILEGWNGSPRTIFLGDLNARPDAPEMVMLSEAGFTDTLVGVSPPASYTWYSADPYQQIDYIWVTPDISFRDAFVPGLTASDHRPVVVEVGD